MRDLLKIFGKQLILEVALEVLTQISDEKPESRVFKFVKKNKEVFNRINQTIQKL